jgi:hypothetical protein
MEIWTSGYRYLDKSHWPQLNLSNQKPLVASVPILPKYLSEADTCSIDPGRSPDTESEIDWPSDIRTRVIAGPIETIARDPLPLPTSRNSLFDNLLSLMLRPNDPAHLQTLVSYHSHPYSRAFHSTRSFNLLISLAIRHASFRTAEHLLFQMAAQGSKGNLETWKLRVRLMVRRGEWSSAWRSVMDTLKTEGWKEQMGIQDNHGDGMPLAIWVEFMSTMKRAAFRKPTVRRVQGVDEGRALEEEREEYHGEEPSEEREQKADVKIGGAERFLNSQRLDLLMQNTPSLTSNEYTRIPGRAVYFTVWMMLRAGHFQDARNMTQSYITGLPPSPDRRTIRAALDIIHLHIPWGFPGSNPLREHQNIRRTVEMFFAIHKDIRPNARTLFLLLRSLRYTKFSGTLARQTTDDFCRKWGYRAESRRVRERITAFAIAEGNIALAETELRKEMQSRFEEWTYAARTELVGGTGRPGYYGYHQLLRRPMRMIYNGHGVYLKRWQYLARKVRRTKKRMAENKRTWRGWRKRSRRRRVGYHRGIYYKLPEH